MHEILDASTGGFLRFAALQGLVAPSSEVPTSAWYAAKLVASLHEDCGPCAQLVVTMAERDGVPAATLRAVLAADRTALDGDTRIAYDYAVATLERGTYRRYGTRAGSLALGSARTRRDRVDDVRLTNVPGGKVRTRSRSRVACASRLAARRSMSPLTARWARSNHPDQASWCLPKTRWPCRFPLLCLAQTIALGE